MIVIHGIYRWRPRRVAFRNDHCRATRMRRARELVSEWVRRGGRISS